MKLLSFILRKKQKESEEKIIKKISYTLSSVRPTKEIYEIAMGIRTEENSKN